MLYIWNKKKTLLILHKKIILAAVSLEKASTTLSIINAFRSAGIIRQNNTQSNSIRLIVDRSQCTRVRNDYTVPMPSQLVLKNEKIPEI